MRFVSSRYVLYIFLDLIVYIQIYVYISTDIYKIYICVITLMPWHKYLCTNLHEIIHVQCKCMCI